MSPRGSHNTWKNNPTWAVQVGCSEAMSHPLSMTTQVISHVKSILTLMRTLVIHTTLTRVPRSAIQCPTLGKGGAFPTCMRVDPLRSRSGHFVLVVDTKCRLVVSFFSQPCFHTGYVRWLKPRRFLRGSKPRFLLNVRMNIRFLVMLSLTSTAMTSVIRRCGFRRSPRLCGPLGVSIHLSPSDSRLG